MDDQLQLQGFCDPAFALVREVFVEHFRSHPSGGLPEVGASVSVVVEGRTVVDLWGGWADAARTRPWTRDTIACTYSCGKAMTALAVHLLAEEGLVDYEEPVARSWPEFAAEGKDGVTIRHLLSHQAGLPSLGRRLAPGDVWSRERIVEGFAGLAPAWPPGEGAAYHSLSFGHLNGEVIQRVTGQPAAQVIRERIGAPLDVDFVYGLTNAEAARCADLVPPEQGDAPSPADLSTLDDYDQFHVVAGSTAVANSSTYRSCDHYLAVGGHSNGRSLARVFGALASSNGVDGVTLLSRARVDETRVAHCQPSTGNGPPLTFGLGWQLPSAAAVSPVATGTGFGHGGRFGSLGWAEPEAELGFGYVMNQTFVWAGDPRAPRLLETALGCL